MKAIIIQPDKSLVWSEVSMPEPMHGQLRIKVLATAVNRADLAQREGAYPPPAGESDILGLEVSGIVEAVGPQASKFEVGQSVMALLAGGGYAQYVVADERLVMPAPKNLSPIEAAAIPEAFVTAHQALFWLGQLDPSQFVLIHGGASGVGTAAIQLAKQRGATVAVTVGSRTKAQACLELGADHAILYKEEDFAAAVKKFTDGRGAHLAIDMVGATYAQQHFKCLAQDARWVVLAFMGGQMGQLDFGRLLMKRIQIVGSTLRSRPLHYKGQLIADFSRKFLPEFDKESIKPVVDRVFPIAEVEKAHQYMAENRNIGKLVLSVDHEDEYRRSETDNG